MTPTTQPETSHTLRQRAHSRRLATVMHPERRAELMREADRLEARAVDVAIFVETGVAS